MAECKLYICIYDSPWVSSGHVFSKKSQMTGIKNGRNELIPTRTITGWKA